MLSKGNSREYFKIEMANAISHGPVSYTHLTLPTNREV